MKMDIAVPTELVHVEHAAYGDARVAYLTFQNESANIITAVSGRLVLRDEDNETLESRRVAFGDLQAMPGERYTCHLALDGFPPFVSATMLVEDVVFVEEEPWALHPSRVRDYVPAILPDGPERIALVAIAGEDAICFPEQDGSLWVCVCGRFNRWRWGSCRRCHRDRDHTLEAYTEPAVMAAYAAKVEKARKLPPRVLIDGERNTQQRTRQSAPPPPPSTKKKRAQKPTSRQKAAKQKPPRSGSGTASRWIAIALGVAVFALIVWGLVSLFGRLPGEISSQLVDINPSGVLDYLDPVH